jgi:tetratricopeptide (TPR) repeat protein
MSWRYPYHGTLKRARCGPPALPALRRPSPPAGGDVLHGYARGKLARGEKEGAIEVFELNAKRFPNQWPVHAGLMRAYSAQGKYQDALAEAKLALAQAPDELNKKALTAMIAKLQAGQDIN